MTEALPKSQDVEEWRPVPIAEFADRYQVSNHGRVRSLRKGGWYIRAIVGPTPNDTAGYPRVMLGKRNCLVHRLVALAFLPPPEPGQTRVLHRDGDPFNCREDNLRWGSARDNAIEAMRHKTMRGSTLDEASVTAMRALHRRHNTPLVELARIFKVSPRSARQIINRDTWDHIP